MLIKWFRGTGIDQNSPFYTFLFDVPWQIKPLDLSSWWKDFALQRYGRFDVRAEQAWQLLAESVYGATQEQKSTCSVKCRCNICM